MTKGWLELIPNNDMSILYYLGKANVVVDALCSYLWVVSPMLRKKREPAQYVHRLSRLRVRLKGSTEGEIEVMIGTELSLMYEI